jgi:hypothetical protein
MKYIHDTCAVWASTRIGMSGDGVCKYCQRDFFLIAVNLAC